MLFNESFAGTNEREGSEIGRQVVAEHFHRQQADSTLFLRAERQPDGRRDYKLTVKDPLPTSFGEDVYYRLGGWLGDEGRVPMIDCDERPGHPPDRTVCTRSTIMWRPSRRTGPSTALTDAELATISWVR
jgi:hypothetical protein